MLASIIISSYNYGRFVADAIQSALCQSYESIEVIVVDDGSTDESRDVIARFDKRIRAIYAEHLGQCASLNRGFAASRGEVVLFLDADDCLLPDAIQELTQPFRGDSNIAQSQGYLDVVDEQLRPLKRTIPVRLSPSGDYRQDALRRGLGVCRQPYTSGSLWPRRFLETLFPLPENSAIDKHGYLGPDGYLNSVALLFGRVASVQKSIGKYRVHGTNQWHGATPFTAESLRAHLAKISYHLDYLSLWARKLGYAPNTERWRKWKRNWADNLAVFALSRLDASQPPPRFHVLVFSPFMAGTTRRLKAVGVMGWLIFIWCAPRAMAMRLARWTLERKIPHLSSSGN